jgi:hypothetical protein
VQIDHPQRSEPTLWADEPADDPLSLLENALREDEPACCGGEHNDDIHSLREENARLRGLVIKLSELVLRNVNHPRWGRINLRCQTSYGTAARAKAEYPASAVAPTRRLRRSSMETAYNRFERCVTTVTRSRQQLRLADSLAEFCNIVQAKVA